MIRNRKKKKPKLIYIMLTRIVLFWLFPLLLSAAAMLFFMTKELRTQIERTIVTSADKAIDICVMRLEDVVVASRNASYITTIEDKYLQYKENGIAQDLYNAVTLFLTQQYKYDENINGAILYFNDNINEIYYTNGTSNSFNYISVKNFQTYYQNRIMEIMSESDTGVQIICIDGKMLMVRNLVNSRFEPFAVLCIEVNTDSIFEALNSVWAADGYKVFADNYELINAGHYTDTDLIDNQKDYTRVGLGAQYIYEDSEAYVHKVVKVEDANIGVNICLNTQDIINEIVGVRSVYALFIIFVVLLIFMIFTFLYKLVNTPIGNLLQGADKITKGDYGYQIEERSESYEFDSLEKSFNSMSMELKHQFEKIYLEELEIRDAQIMALQSQINPHFLNNTLEIINWECRMTGNTRTSSMIEALSIMLNATMNREKKNMIPLSEELSYVDAYLLIIQQRFGSRLKINKNIDYSILLVEVPRLIIQPIIENAVTHGLDAKNQGTINLNIYVVGDKVYIDVVNKGVMTEEDYRKVEYLLGPDFKKEGVGSTSLGIRNVNRRLKIIYGEECGLTIRSNEEGYTVSRIIIDMNYKEEEKDEEENITK